MAQKSILVAEDDAVLRSLYVKKFEVAGYRVRIAADGDEAAKEIEKEAPDLLILDIHMPKLDGFQVMERFPKASRKFPIVLLTNFDQMDFKLKGSEMGAEDYFVKKDMTIRTLLEKVQKLIG
mgnify:CR=1 FL=1